jgi:hypothetical protein
VIQNVLSHFQTYNGFATQNNIMSSPQDALNIATATAASVQALAAALQQHSLQTSQQPKVLFGNRTQRPGFNTLKQSSL